MVKRGRIRMTKVDRQVNSISNEIFSLPLEIYAMSNFNLFGIAPKAGPECAKRR